jgi:hypothetical protein
VGNTSDGLPVNVPSGKNCHKIVFKITISPDEGQKRGPETRPFWSTLVLCEEFRP